LMFLQHPRAAQFSTPCDCQQQYFFRESSFSPLQLLADHIEFGGIRHGIKQWLKHALAQWRRDAECRAK